MPPGASAGRRRRAGRRAHPLGFGPVTILSLAALLSAATLAVSAGAHQPPMPAPDDETSTRDQGRLDPRLAGLCLVAFCALFTEGTIADWSSIYLQGVLEGGFAVGFFAFSVGMTIGRLGGDVRLYGVPVGARRHRWTDPFSDAAPRPAGAGDDDRRHRRHQPARLPASDWCSAVPQRLTRTIPNTMARPPATKFSVSGSPSSSAPNSAPNTGDKNENTPSCEAR